MRRHLLVVSEKKIKMLKTPFVIAQGEVLQVAHNNFLRLTHLDYKHVHTIRPQFFYFLFYGFSGPISDVGGRKKNKNKI